MARGSSEAHVLVLACQPRRPAFHLGEAGGADSPTGCPAPNHAELAFWAGHTPVPHGLGERFSLSEPQFPQMGSAFY